MLDADGYPTDELLKHIKTKYKFTNYKVTDIEPLLELLKENWRFGIKMCKRKNKIYLQLHTMGWSGNEDIIDALKGSWLNIFFKTKWERGGHYYYEIITGD